MSSKCAKSCGVAPRLRSIGQSVLPGVKLVAPRGAFYAHPRLDIPEDDLTFVTDLLKQKHVLVVHGSGFGEKPGTRHIRIVFLPQEPVLNSAYEAMTAFMRERYS